MRHPEFLGHVFYVALSNLEMSPSPLVIASEAANNRLVRSLSSLVNKPNLCLISFSLSSMPHRLPHSVLLHYLYFLTTPTSNHPFLTLEENFLPAGKLTAGLHIRRADGSIGIVTQVKRIIGTQIMYNLEVANDHTFTVGSGSWIVHNGLTCM